VRNILCTTPLHYPVHEGDGERLGKGAFLAYPEPELGILSVEFYREGNIGQVRIRGRVFDIDHGRGKLVVAPGVHLVNRI